MLGKSQFNRYRPNVTLLKYRLSTALIVLLLTRCVTGSV